MRMAVKSISTRDTHAKDYATSQNLKFQCVKDEPWFTQEVAHDYHLWLEYVAVENVGNHHEVTEKRPSDLDQTVFGSD